jgi:CopG family nickel-responsive transcriptional regulator
MGQLARIGVAIESSLLARFDRLIAKQGYATRSEAFRDLIRERLTASVAANPDIPVVGSITLIYDHHARLLPERLANLQHDHHDLIVSTTHAHLDHDTCLEVVVVRGPSGRVQKLADALIGTKGVHHGRSVISSPSAYLSKTA